MTNRYFIHSGLGLVGAVIVAAVFILFLGVRYFAYKTYIIKETPVACTQEAKRCPDGSYVSRTGPNCEFSECPQPGLGQDDIFTWKTYRNEKYGFEFRYPSGWQNEEAALDDVSNVFKFSIVLRQKSNPALNIILNIDKSTTNEYAEKIDSMQNSVSYELKYINKSTWRMYELKKEDISGTFKTALTFRENLVYQIISPESATDDIYYQILSTFKFTK